tara:strand:- start:187 stop:480 length:294 start_codon:yes stop_codon:yes gene_type:complete
METITAKLVEYGVLGIMVVGLSIAVVFLAKLLKKTWEDAYTLQDRHYKERIEEQGKYFASLDGVSEKLSNGQRSIMDSINVQTQILKDLHNARQRDR